MNIFKPFSIFVGKITWRRLCFGCVNQKLVCFFSGSDPLAFFFFLILIIYNQLEKKARKDLEGVYTEGSERKQWKSRLFLPPK